MRHLLSVCMPWVMLLTAVAGACAQPQPGRTFEFQWEPARTALPVFVPTDHDAQSPPPVFVFFHGTNGRPTLGPIVEACDGRGFVVVGNTYLKQGLFDSNAEQVHREWANTKKMLAALSDKVAFDPNRVYVGGFSKGGWIASLILELHPDDIAGAWIGGAGKALRVRLASVRAKTPKPAYFGVGETDPNRIASLDAIDHFTKLNAQVTYDEFPGIGHRYAVTSAMRDWLLAERLRGTEALTTTAKKKLDGLLESEADPWTRYRTLTEAQHGPWYHAAEANDRALIDRTLVELRRNPEVKEQFRAKLAYDRILRKEMAMHGSPARGRTIADAYAKSIQRKKDMLADYRRFMEQHTGTFYAEKAKADVTRVEAHLQHLEKHIESRR